MSAPMPKSVYQNVLELERVSTNKQDLKRQEYDLAQNRREYGLTAVGKVSIKESGEKVLKSEDVDKIVAGLKRADVDALSVSAIDRISRPQDLGDIGWFQIFIDLKKAIISKREGVVEPWTPRGRKALLGALTQAGNELSDLKDRLASNRFKMHEQKRMVNVTPPFAYIYIDKHHRDGNGKYHLDQTPQSFLLDPVESSLEGMSKADVVIQVFHWRYHNKLKPGKIAKKLNEMGILTGGKKGQYEPGLWQRGTVIQMLKNRHYIGEHVEGGVLVDCPCPQIISREIFDGVQAMWSAKRNDNGRDSRKHLLAGYLKCKKCGRKYRTSGGRYPSYMCGHFDYKRRTQICRDNTQIRSTIIEELVWAAIWKFLTQPALLLANAKAYYDSRPTKGGTAKLEAELAIVRERMERMGEMVYLGTFDKAKGNALILADKARVGEIEAELKAAGRVVTLPALSDVEAGCREISDPANEPAVFATRRPILEKLVDLEVVFDCGTYEIFGQVPVAAMAQKCNRRIHGDYTSVLYIPFYLKGKIEEMPRITREVALKIWEKRRQNGTTASLSGAAMRKASLKGWETRRKGKAA